MSCSQGLLVVVPFPLVLVPDEHFHCSEGWVKGLYTAPKYTVIHFYTACQKYKIKKTWGLSLTAFMRLSYFVHCKKIT